jgi:hypothetical protein
VKKPLNRKKTMVLIACAAAFLAVVTVLGVVFADEAVLTDFSIKTSPQHGSIRSARTGWAGICCCGRCAAFR